MENLIKKYSEVGIKDIEKVGGKNASLGEMISQLSTQNINVPDGFATTATAFWLFIDSNQLRKPIENLLLQIDKDYTNLNNIGLSIRTKILEAEMPSELSEAIEAGYKILSGPNEVAVAVRSSATAEDLPQASFAGQHDSFLNINGAQELIKAVQKCFASLYTNRAIKYREDNGFEHAKIALSVGVQKMVRADKACSGVCFTIEPESGFQNIIHISGVWGLGENIVQGEVTPDEFLVFKPTLKQGKNAIVQKKLGAKEQTMVYASDKNSDSPVINTPTPEDKKARFVLTNNEVLMLAQWALTIEQHYSKPMDIEWAKDGETGELFIIQARPETVHSQNKKSTLQKFELEKRGKILVSGSAIGSKITVGIARILHSPKEAHKLQKGEIIVTDGTSPDWDPVLQKASAIITNKGGRTSHASIVARELGVPAIVGCKNATEVIQNGSTITVSCSEGDVGFVYEGKLPYKETSYDFTKTKKLAHTEAMLIVGNPDNAFNLSFYPNSGVGLMRMEFIINHSVQVHPMALVKFNHIKDKEEKEKIEALTKGYSKKEDYFIEKLSEGIATIGAAFYPKDVIVRMSDFKTNEYANLVGGSQFEPDEENPMLGFRGASRYYNYLYQDGFALECEAIKKVRIDMGLHNIKIMIPFCRTVHEARKTIEVLKLNGLDRTKDRSLEIYMMAEIPSNVLLAEEFAKLFDGFSIGSNDLTQLTLGIDRDSTIISDLFNEQDASVKIMIEMMIDKAKRAGVKIGLCGQAPSDNPAFAQFLVQKQIDSISFNPDALLNGIENIYKAESKLKTTEGILSF